MFLSIVEPIAVDDSIDNQLRNQIGRVNKASGDVVKNYKAVIEEERLGRSTQNSDCKQLRNILHEAIESCANYHQMSREVFTEPYEETQTKLFHHLRVK